MHIMKLFEILDGQNLEKCSTFPLSVLVRFFIL